MLKADSSVDTFLCGDLNFVEDREDTTGPFTPLPASFVDAWSSLKSKFNISDVPHASNTYFHLTSDPSSPHSWASRLDRFLVPLLSSPTPSSLLMSMFSTTLPTIAPNLLFAPVSPTTSLFSSRST